MSHETTHYHTFESPYGSISITKELSSAMVNCTRIAESGASLFDRATDRSRKLQDAIDLLALVAFENGFGSDIKQLFK